MVKRKATPKNVKTRRQASPGGGPSGGAARPPCACGCGAPAEIDFAGLFYTKACFQKEIEGLRAVGIPIEESDQGVRLRPGTSVVFVDDGDPTKVH
jgi:hypothetical protein